MENKSNNNIMATKKDKRLYLYTKLRVIPNNKVYDKETNRLISEKTFINRVKKKPLSNFVLPIDKKYNANKKQIVINKDITKKQKEYKKLLDKNYIKKNTQPKKINFDIDKTQTKSWNIRKMNFKYKKSNPILIDTGYSDTIMNNILKNMAETILKFRKSNEAFQINIQTELDDGKIVYWSSPVIDKNKYKNVNDLYDYIETELSKIVSSNATVLIDGNTKISIKYYDSPNASGGVKISPWLKGKTKSIYPIENKDCSCGLRCLVLSNCNADRRKYLKKAPKAFEKDLLKLSEEINHSIYKPMNYYDFDKYVDKYPNKRVIIIGAFYTEKFITKNKDAEEDIYIYHDEEINHYHLITNINGFCNDENGHYCYCRMCRKRMDKRSYDKHSCKGLKCSLCGTTFKNEKEKEEHMKMKGTSANCSNCNLRCRGDKCLELHQNGRPRTLNDKGCKGCSTNMWFYDCCYKEGYSVKECWGRQEDKEVHKCDHAYCKTCEEYKPRKHRCWLKPYSYKMADLAVEESGLQNIVCFDFESFIEDNGRHEVSLIVAKERIGGTHIWRWKKNGDDILLDFIKWCMDKTKTTFIAHNGKAYDTWLIHQKLCEMTNKRPDKIILAGQKIMYMELRGNKFIDSINHFAIALEKVPKTFGLDTKQFKKGFYPYIFNTKNNLTYKGVMPHINYFQPNLMNKDKRKEFIEWYNDRIENNNYWNHQTETEEYCISDVDILLQGCNVYSNIGYDKTGIDPLTKKTIAGWVMCVYRTKYYDYDKTPICVLKKEEYDFIKKAFHGGRTETIRPYKKWNEEELNNGVGGRYLDIQSLYPSVQFYDDMPYGEPKWIEENITDIDKINKMINENYGWFEVDIIMNKKLYMCPLVSKETGKLTADCLDKNKQVFHSVELKEALNCGCKITKIHSGLIMDATKDMFKDFIKDFLEMKVNASEKPNKETLNKLNLTYEDWIEYHEKEFDFTPNPNYNAGLRSISKMVLNSLWGKFGQRPDMPKNEYIHKDKISRWYDLLRDNEKQKKLIKSQEVCCNGEYMYVAFCELDDNNNEVLKSTNLAIASSTTANAGMRLFKELKPLDKRVLYHDTDSIIYEHDPQKYNIKEGLFLGEWECETKGKLITEFVSIGAKSYAYKVEDKVKDCKMKGISLHYDNSNKVNFEGMLKLVKGNTDKIITDKNVRFDKNKENGISTTMITKEVKATLDKRIVKEDYYSYPFGYVN